MAQGAEAEAQPSRDAGSFVYHGVFERDRAVLRVFLSLRRAAGMGYRSRDGRCVALCSKNTLVKLESGWRCEMREGE